MVEVGRDSLRRENAVTRLGAANHDGAPHLPKFLRTGRSWFFKRMFHSLRRSRYAKTQK